MMLKALLGWKGYVAAAGAGAIVAGLVVGVGQGWRHDAKISAMVASHAQVMQGYADAAYTASEQARAEEHRRIAAIEESEHETQRRLAAAIADERHAADVRVRNVATEYATRYNGMAERATAAAEREAASAAIGMFAELLSGTDDLAGVYAAHADRSRVAGLACERAYEALDVSLP